MNDVLLLGAVSVGLGLYCLHLHHKIKMLHRAGMFGVELMVFVIRKYTDMTEDQAVDEVRRIAFERGMGIGRK